MRLRLYHHRDGARVAYRETGTGRPLVLLHSLGLSHREWEPIVGRLSTRFRVVLPDLPLHGDSEDRPRHPYTREWFIEVIGGFCADVVGPRPALAGHDLGAELALGIVLSGVVDAHSLVLMPNRLHRANTHRLRRSVWRSACQLGAVPGLDRLLSRGAKLVFRPSLGEQLSAQGNPAARDLVRHAFADVAGNGNRARAWAKFARRWPNAPQVELLEAYAQISTPVLLLWAEDDRLFALDGANEALARLPNGQLRTLPGAGFLIAYDDPVGVARELISFCG